MHPYRPPSPALLLSLWLLLSLALPAAAATPRDQEITVVPAQSPAVGLPRGILQLAGSTALHFFNFRAGSPSGLQVLAGVQEGRAWVDPQEGCEVDLVFSTKPYNPEQEGEERLGRCSARVFFKKNKPRPAINVTCARLIEKAKRQEKDYVLYKQMKLLTTSLRVISIPDPYGHVDPSLSPLRDLAFLGSSYVMWEKTSQHLHYSMVQLSSVKHLNMNDDGVDFDFTVLLHEFSTQEIIPCRIQLLWYPGKPLKVKYHCQELQGPDEGSGSGSAMEPTELSNFEREKELLLSNPTSSHLHKQRSRRPGRQACTNKSTFGSPACFSLDLPWCLTERCTELTAQDLPVTAHSTHSRRMAIASGKRAHL